MHGPFLTRGGLPRLFDRMVRLRPAEAWLLILFCVDAAALVDRLTGPDLWFGPVYLFVICVAAWCRGWRDGELTGIACLAITFAVNGLALYPYGGAAFAWNLSMRFAAISIVVAIIAGVRGAYVREWWLARSDVLTGALNRQAFFELAPEMIRTQGWRLLVYCDLDGLKQINDLHGHSAGDSCLRDFGAAGRKMIRRNDVFARMGGDEFVIFMNVKDEAAARKVASRLHKGMNQITAGGRTLKCSVGGLVVPPGHTSVDELVRSADNLMYKAKLRGASLQMALASNVQPTGRARAASRSSSSRVLGQRNGATERRAATTDHVRERLPQ